MRIISKNRISTCLLVFAIIASTLLLAVINIKNSSSVDPTGMCTNVQILTPNQSQNQTLVSLYSTAEFSITGLPYQPSSIKMGVIESGSDTPITIGRAQPTASGSFEWKFVWPTQLWKIHNAGGNVNIKASILFQNGTNCEVEPTTQYYISYNPIGNLLLNVSPQEIIMNVGPLNTQEIIASPIVIPTGLNIPTDILNKYGIFEWSTENNNIGSITSNTDLFVSNSRIIFNAGNYAGSNTIKTQFKYGGSESNIALINVTIKPIQIENTTTQNTGSTNIGNNDGSASIADPVQKKTDETNKVSTTTPITTSELSTLNQVSSNKLEINDSTKDCLLESGSITKERLNQIIANESRPTSEELSKISNCFATSKYILPSNFSPVDPNKIENLEGDESKVSISKIENDKKTVGSTKKDTLKIAGKAKANSTVFIYIYSDPIIVTTTTDANGNWQYILEDPLTPAKHEVYTIVNKGDGTYVRSDPWTFIVSKAAATSSNPNGLNLKLTGTPIKSASQSQIFLAYYIGGAVLLLAVAFSGLFVITKTRHKHKLEIAKLNDPNCPHCGMDKNEQPIPVSANPADVSNQNSNQEPNPFSTVSENQLETNSENQNIVTEQKE